MNRLLGVLLIAVTLVLVGWGYMESAGAAGVLRSDDTPEPATLVLLTIRWRMPANSIATISFMTLPALTEAFVPTHRFRTPTSP